MPWLWKPNLFGIEYTQVQDMQLLDLIYSQKCLFMLQIENNKQLAASFSELKYCGEDDNCTT